MKPSKHLPLALLFLLAFSVKNLSAQWTTLNSGTTQNLLSLSFLNASYGLVGGENGVLRLTTDGGSTWTPLNPQTNAGIEDVRIVNTDTFLISYNQNFVTQQMLTTDGGVTWNLIAADSICFRSINTVMNSTGKWFSIGNTLRSSVDYGASWDTLYDYTCGTQDIDRIKFTGDQFVNLGGNQSGFVTYSASMLRSEDFGITFYPLDPFSFPNADYLSAFSSDSPDTIFIFMNQYNGFTPGTINSLYKIYNFQTQVIGSTYYVFSNSLVNNSLPSYVNDAHFYSSNFGIAAGNDGNIYETTNGGQSWTNAFTGNGSIVRFAVTTENTAYAIGKNGQIIKNDQLNLISQISKRSLSISPNPACIEIHLNGLPDSRAFSYSIFTNLMQEVGRGKISDGQKINLETIKAGSYFIRVSDDNSQTFLPLIVR